MKILVLDDDQRRHFYFATWFAKDNIKHAFDITQFSEYIGSDIFDCIFLDHDLNGTMIDYLDGPVHELTGLDAAKMLVDLPLEMRPKQVFVHSWNPAGADMMVRLLRDNGFSVTRWRFDPGAQVI